MARGPKAIALHLSEHERAELERIVRRRSAGQSLKRGAFLRVQGDRSRLQSMGHGCLPQGDRNSLNLVGPPCKNTSNSDHLLQVY